MRLDIYEIVTLIAGVLSTYAKYIFMSFFAVDELKVGKLGNILMFTAYHLLVAIVYLGFYNPNFTLIANFVILGIIYWINLRSVKRTLLAVPLAIGTAFAIELLTVFIVKMNNVPVSFEEAANYKSALIIVIVNIVYFMVAMLIRRFTHNKRRVDIPNSYWLTILIIPIGTFYFIYTMFYHMEANWEIVIAVCILSILMNLVVFSMFDIIHRFYLEKEEKEAANLMNISSLRQLELIEESTQSMQSVNHDLKRHLSMVNGMIKDGELLSATEYIDDIVSTELEDKSFCRSGNYIVDSIVNYELGLYDAGSVEIKTNIKSLPSEIDISDYEMTSLLSNLLTNARQALNKVDRERTLEVTIEYKLGMLYILITNTYNGQIIESKGRLYTTKNDKMLHGFGLTTIEKIVKKYDGEITVDYDEHVFSVEVVMYA